MKLEPSSYDVIMLRTMKRLNRLGRSFVTVGELARAARKLYRKRLDVVKCLGACERVRARYLAWARRYGRGVYIGPLPSKFMSGLV